ncbi:MAG: alpha/beta fold hydrolase, partial [Burkholderiales bacterium]
RTAHYLQDVAELFRIVQVNGAIEAPVLLVLSSGATFAAPARTREIVAQWATPSVVTIQAEHWPLTEKPDEVRQAIEAWVEGLPTATQTISAGT